MTAEVATNHIEETLLPPEPEMRIIPAHPKVISLIQSAKEAVLTNDLLLPTSHFANSNWRTSTSWVVSPPLAESSTEGTTEERISWAGYKNSRQHCITTIGGRFSDTSFGGEGVSSVLEVGVLRAEDDEDDSTHQDVGHKRSPIASHCIYASGLPISPAGEMVLIAGKPNFADFDLTTSLHSLARGEQGDFLLRVMIESILQQSNIGSLTEVIIDESSEHAPRIIRRIIEAGTSIEDEEAA